MFNIVLNTPLKCLNHPATHLKLKKEKGFCENLVDGTLTQPVSFKIFT